jgi:hypothetical protein
VAYSWTKRTFAGRWGRHADRSRAVQAAGRDRLLAAGDPRLQIAGAVTAHHCPDRLTGEQALAPWRGERDARPVGLGGGRRALDGEVQATVNGCSFVRRRLRGRRNQQDRENGQGPRPSAGLRGSLDQCAGICSPRS